MSEPPVTGNGNGNGTPIAPLDFSGVIPPAFSTTIIEEAILQSAALRLGNRIPMGTRIAQMPVPKAFPKAGWSSTPYGGRKPYTDLKLDIETITAEEVAAVVAIPDAMVDDSAINLWNWVRPRLAEAIAMAVDEAMLFGIDAPSTFPAGGVVGQALSVDAGDDAVATVNDAMSAVEDQGLTVSGHAMDIGSKGALRGVRDGSNALLLGTQQVASGSIDTLYGLPISYAQFAQRVPDFITGAWQNLLIGVRQDIRYDMNPAAVLADAEGKVVISGFQDNVLPMKVWARFGCVILKPVTLREPEGATPFAVSTLREGASGASAGISGHSAASSQTASVRSRTPKESAKA